MSFNPNQDHSISLAEAAVLTKAYRDANPGAKIGGFFGKVAIETILNQPNCVGLKYYFAIENGEPTLVLCGAEANQDDLYLGSLAENDDADPPNSSTPNPLNS